MARIRTIKPEFWTSEQLAECSTSARLLFIGLWTFSDCRGVHPASVARLKMEVFPADPFTTADMNGWMAELIRVGLVRPFTAEGKEYWAVTGWHHQKIDRPAYKYPAPPLVEDSSRTRRMLVVSHPPEGMGKGWVEETHAQHTYTVEGQPQTPTMPPPAPARRPPAKTDTDLRPLFDAYCRGTGHKLTWGHRYTIPAEQLHAAGLTPAEIEAAARFYRAKLTDAVPSLARFAAEADRWHAARQAGDAPAPAKPEKPGLGAPSPAARQLWCSPCMTTHPGPCPRRNGGITNA